MHVPHALTEWAGKWLARRFGGVRPEMILSPEQVEQIRPGVRAAMRRLHWWCIPIGLVATGGLTAGLVWLRRATEPAPNGAVLDDHTGTFWLGFGVISFMAVLLVCSVFEYRCVRKSFGPDAELYEHYCATTSGWRPRRKFALMCGFIVPAALLVGCLIWNLGDVVDRNGVAWGDHPFARTYEPMSAVRSIELYDGLVAPIGLRMVPNVHVTFADGKRWRNVPGDRDTHVPVAVAVFLSSQSGIPVTQPGIWK